MKSGILTALVFLGSLSKPVLVLVDTGLMSVGASRPNLNIGRLVKSDRERRQIFRCVAVAGLLLFLYLFYAVPLCVLFSALTLALLIWLYPFQIVDNLLGHVLSKTIFRYEPTRWSGSHKERTKIYPIYLLGISLIVMLPFQHYRHMVDVLHIQSRLPIISGIIETNQTFEFWELAVCLWSLLFLLIFFLRELGGHVETLALKQSTSFFLGIGGFIVVSLCAGATGYLLLSHQPAVYRIIAELLVIGLLCTSDILFYVWYRKKAKELADDFALFLLVLDGPSLLAFLVLWAYLAGAPPSDWKLPFASGAAALNLVLVNTVFSFLYIIERYRSTPGRDANTNTPSGLAPIDVV